MTQNVTPLPQPPPITGLVAHKYELLRMIGRGGMGSVWEGKHVTLGTRVAIKFIEAEYVESVEARQRFDNEARTAATLQSKHAIQIYDHGVTDDGKPYIVMELLTGEPLDKRIERLGRLSLQETARIIQQVSRALAKAHEKGIIHRDLKPENIFIVRSEDDDEEIAKVLDFGIAKFKAGSNSGISSSTKTGAVLGTPFYMSPEQARGLRSVDHRSDLWSLGVIVYKCITGVLPFDGESVGDLLVKICTAPLPLPSHLLPGLPHAFDQWFAHALEREPDRRFSTAQELSDSLSYACGVSLRRGGVSDGGPYVGGDGRASSSPSNPIPYGSYAPGSPTPPGAVMAASATQNATQAQFSATGPGVPQTSRGLLLGSVAAAIIGLAGGALLVVKLSGPRPDKTHVQPGASGTGIVSTAPSVAGEPKPGARDSRDQATVEIAALDAGAGEHAGGVINSPPPKGPRPIPTTTADARDKRPGIAQKPPVPPGTIIVPPLPTFNFPPAQPPQPKPPAPNPNDPGY